jgi:hypothetical protein
MVETRGDAVVIIDPVAHFFRYVPAARSKGLDVLVLTANPEICLAEQTAYAAAVGDYPESGVGRFLSYEAGSDDSAIAALQPHRNRIRGVVAGDEVSVAMAARIGCRLGFPYASPEDALCQQIKSTMKKRLVERGVPTPPYAAVTTLDQAAAAWRRFGRDAMIKMVDYAMSFGVFRVRTRAELDAAWESIRSGRHSLDHALPPEESVVVEQHVGGREFSVEGYVSEDRVEILNFCEKLTHPNFMVVGHYIPAVTDTEEAGLLRDVAVQCAVALGIRNSVFHAEAHVDQGQAWLIECASRPPGQFSVSVLERVYGFDLMDISLDLACGNPVEVERREPRSWNAIMALYSDRPGIVRGLESLDELRGRPECYCLRCEVKPGDVVNRLESFRDVLGLALLEAPHPESVRAAYEWARSSVRFRF